MIYLLDSTVISDLIIMRQPVVTRFETHLRRGDRLLLCQPVHYEIMRGLFWRGSGKKINAFNTSFLPRLERITLADADWLQAVRFWADAQTKGKQLSDIDLLIASIAHRLDAVIASSDDDFDILPVKRNDWRISM